MKSLRLAACLLLLLSVGAPGPRAEVAVALNQTGQGHTLYIVETIHDDPDPVGRAWLRYNTDAGNRRVLNDQGFADGDGPPSAVVNPVSQVPIVVWSKNTPGGYDIVVSQFTNDAWTSPETLADAPQDELDPVLAVDPSDGTVHLVYWIKTPTFRVMHQQAPADLSSWSAPLQVSQPGQISARPSVTVHDGQLRVVYEEHPLGYGFAPRQIVLAAGDQGGFVTETLATSLNSESNWPRVHSAMGRLWVDWIDDVDEMSWTRQVVAGSWDPVQAEPFSGVEDRDYRARNTIRALALQ